MVKNFFIKFSKSFLFITFVDEWKMFLIELKHEKIVDIFWFELKVIQSKILLELLDIKDEYVIFFKQIKAEFDDIYIFTILAYEEFHRNMYHEWKLIYLWGRFHYKTSSMPKFGLIYKQISSENILKIFIDEYKNLWNDFYKEISIIFEIFIQDWMIFFNQILREVVDFNVRSKFFISILYFYIFIYKFVNFIFSIKLQYFFFALLIIFYISSLSVSFILSSSVIFIFIFILKKFIFNKSSYNSFEFIDLSIFKKFINNFEKNNFSSNLFNDDLTFLIAFVNKNKFLAHIINIKKNE